MAPGSEAVRTEGAGRKGADGMSMKEPEVVHAAREIC